MASVQVDLPRLGHIGAAIREAMTRLDMTPSQVNMALGRPKSDAGIYLWRAAKAAPHLKYKAAVAKLLGLKIEDLTPRKESPMPRPGERGRPRNGVSDAVPVPAALKPVGYHPGGYGGGGTRDVLSFRVNAAGRARISLDVEMELAQATPLLRLLLDAGLVLGPTGAGTDG